MDLRKYAYLSGMFIRNRKISACYEYLKQSEAWDRQKLEEAQLARLQNLLSTAYSHSPFYRNKFNEHDFHPSRLTSLDDLKKVPATTKQEVLENSKAIQVQNCREKLFFSETSGSTGKPLVFYRNQEWDAWHNASVLRGYSWHNVQPWERNGYLWGYNIAPEKRMKVKFFDFLQNRFRLFSYKDGDVQRFVNRLENADYLEGYSSMLYEVAKKINNENLSHKFALKMIKGTSEKIYETYQAEVEKAFGKKIISEYGSAEGGIIAFECAKGRMHINMETVIVETIDNEIVVTNLVSNSFPVIRYKLGDYIKVDDITRCDCGMSHPIIVEITGRVGSVIYGKTCTYPSLTLYYVFKNLALVNNVVLNYQVIQKTKGSIIANIESCLSEKHKTLLTREFLKYFGTDLDVTIMDNAKRSDYSCKKKDFISYVPGAAP